MVEDETHVAGTRSVLRFFENKVGEKMLACSLSLFLCSKLAKIKIISCKSIVKISDYYY